MSAKIKKAYDPPYSKAKNNKAKNVFLKIKKGKKHSSFPMGLILIAINQ